LFESIIQTSSMKKILNISAIKTLHIPIGVVMLTLLRNLYSTLCLFT
jgi:hypothetical protein